MNPSTLWRRLAAVAGLGLALAAATAAPAGATDSHALIQGSGSSWSSNAINQWIADVQSNGLQVVFTASGSAQGRKDFAFKTTDFAVSDIGYQGTDSSNGDEDTAMGRAFSYLPVVAGGTSFPYQVRVGGQLVRNIRLSGLTLAKIFTNQITNWNDAAITADNNGRQLPSLPIIPVVHSEGSGSTAQFTRYLDKQFPALWKAYNGSSGLTEYYPKQGDQIAQNGSDGVMNFIASGAANGAIGYDEYSYALAKNYPVVKLGNAAGYYTAPTQYNVAVALTKAAINMDKTSPDYLLQDLDNVYTDSDKRAYAMSSYSYLLIPTAADDQRMTTAKRQTLADFLNYSVCAGQAEMGPIGYSPLPINLAQASFDQVKKLKTADPNVDITQSDVTKCNNPTFDKSNPSRNYLAEIAPQPPACDKSGAGPCTGSAGLVTGNPKGGKAGGGTTGSSTTGGTTGGATGSTGTTGSSIGGTTGAATSGGTTGTTGAATGTTTGAVGSGAKVDPVTGQVVSNGNGTGSGASTSVSDSSTELASSDRGLSHVLGPLAVLELLAAIVLPPLIARRLLSKRAGA